MTSRAKEGQIGIYIGDTPPEKPAKSPIVSCLGIEIGHLSENVQFAILSSLIMVFFLIYGYTQEWIFRQEGMKPHGWYLTLVLFAFYSVISRIEMSMWGEIRRIPFKTYLFLALTTLTTMGFSNASLGYLNYPTQVIFKCCKLIPVLIGGILIQRKRYGPLDFGAALVMCLGLIFFTLADSKVSPNFDFMGVVMISIALVADAIIGNVQEKTMKQYHAGNAEVIFFSYGIGFIYLLFGLAVTGYLLPGVTFFAENPGQKYGSALIYSLSGYSGMQIVLTFVRRFGAFVTVTVTSFRKVLTITLSFVLFSKPFTMQYVYSGALVLLGIYFNLLSKNYRHVDWNTLYFGLISQFTSRKPHMHSSRV